ncbi:MAG TPA: histidinol dehydrogenase, partial [Candidatus Acidoferrum sp.]
MMRILKLTAKMEAALARLREGRNRSAQKAAARIVSDVRARGDVALERWTEKLDGTDIRGGRLWISIDELAAAKKRVSADFLRAVKHAAANVRRVAEKQMPQEWTLQVEPGVTVGQMVSPLDSIGCYIPGGRFALVSTLVMTVVPAQVAGVKKIVAVCPHPNDELLAAAHVLGVRRLARIGGAQAIAALAYGTKRVPRVEKICGPGNRYVTAAKQIVSSDCAIDLPAGPTEAIVLANGGDARFIAADMLAQAEHAPDAGSYLVTSSMRFAQRVQREVSAQLGKLARTNPAHISVEKTGAILLATSWNEACEFVNRFAPEHLSLPEKNSSALRRIRSSGTIFVGPLSAQ